MSNAIILNRITAAMAVCLILVAASRADEPTTKPIKPTGKCMMWKATSKTATVYLVGSTHVAKQDMYPLPNEMEDAFAKADQLVVEINIDKIDQSKLLKMVMDKGMYKGDETLSGHLKPETWTALKAACEKAGLPAEGVDKMKPWLVSMTLQQMAFQQSGLDPAMGIDKHFLEEAEKKSLDIGELETAESQIDVLAGLDSDVQDEQLNHVLEKKAGASGELDKLIDTWVAGDADAMGKLLTDEDKDAAAVMQKVLYDRNGPMAAKVEDYLKGTKTVFVVVGCGHLVGDKGIVKILRDDKFAVVQSTATAAAKAGK